MKMRFVILTMVWLLCCSLSAGAMNFTADAKRNCQQMDSENGTVTLIFATDQAHFALPKDSILGVWVSGSICDLQDSAAAYRLDEWSEDSCFYHTFRCDELLKPGNSGQPEFVFYVLKADSTDANIYGYDLRQVRMDEELLCYNGIPYTMILLPCGPDYFTTDRAELSARVEDAREIRPLALFDLTDSIAQHEISNFRLVPGTRYLYRSYHPYFPTNAKYDTEQQRLYWVAELARQAGVKSTISLTGNLEYSSGQWYTCGGDSFQIEIPDYQQALINRGDILYVGQTLGRNPSVPECYYQSEDVFFASYMREVILFLADTTHPMPVQIHCAIGADRTGMVCAVLAALCGADWEDIMHDYQLTGRMRIQAYRHPNRLRYALERMTGVRPDDCTSAQLAAAIRRHLVDTMGVLTHEQIDAMVVRLRGAVPSALAAPVMPRQSPCYDLLGRPASPSSQGIVIDNEKKWRIIP